MLSGEKIFKKYTFFPFFFFIKLFLLLTEFFTRSHNLFHSFKLDAARIFVIEIPFQVIGERQVHSERNLLDLRGERLT